MSPLSNDPAEREKALQAALQARHDRALLKSQVRDGHLSLADLLARGHRGATDEVGDHARTAGRIDVGDAVLAVRHIGPVKAAKILAEAGVDADTNLDELSHDDVEAIVAGVGAHGG